MSKIGKQPIQIKENVTVSLEKDIIKTSGPQGVLTFSIPEGVDISVAEGKVIVSQKKKSEQTRAIYGLTRATIANMVKGVSEGFSKKLELSGVGYRASVAGDNLTLSVGFSHTVKVVAPSGIKFEVKESTITVFGMDKTLVGNTAAKIRDIRPPEPYKGKGIKYAGEKIRRKAGKAAKAVGTK